MATGCRAPDLFLDVAFGAAPRMPVVVRVRALSEGCCCKVVAAPGAPNGVSRRAVTCEGCCLNAAYARAS